MKLILAIVSSDGSTAVQAALTKGHFPITKPAATGGFLKADNITFIVGVGDDKVEEVISKIATHSSRRTRIVLSTLAMDMELYTPFPVEIVVGGSTIFVMNAERYEEV